MQLLNEKYGLERKCADLRVVSLLDFVESLHLWRLGSDYLIPLGD